MTERERDRMDEMKWDYQQERLFEDRLAEEEAEDEDTDICGCCNGSGEGRHDGSRCPVCKGRGEV